MFSKCLSFAIRVTAKCTFSLIVNMEFVVNLKSNPNSLIQLRLLETHICKHKSRKVGKFVTEMPITRTELYRDLVSDNSSRSKFSQFYIFSCLMLF
jgi:hypothetical protein